MPKLALPALGQLTDVCGGHGSLPHASAVHIFRLTSLGMTVLDSPFFNSNHITSLPHPMTSTSLSKNKVPRVHSNIMPREECIHSCKSYHLQLFILLHAYIFIQASIVTGVYSHIYIYNFFCTLIICCIYISFHLRTS